MCWEEHFLQYTMNDIYAPSAEMNENSQTLDQNKKSNARYTTVNRRNYLDCISFFYELNFNCF